MNEKGGVHGRKLEIILGDHACNEAKGVAVAKKLISQDQVFLLNGGICSGVALAMRPVIEEAGVPWVVSTAVNQKISTPIAKNIFHASQTSEAAGHAFAKFILSKEGSQEDRHHRAHQRVVEGISRSRWSHTSKARASLPPKR